MTSLYHYMNSECSFSSFIRERNDHIPIIRNIMELDSNRVK